MTAHPGLPEQPNEVKPLLGLFLQDSTVYSPAQVEAEELVAVHLLNFSPFDGERLHGGGVGWGGGGFFLKSMMISLVLSTLRMRSLSSPWAVVLLTEVL